jgi:hypothetical protein
MVASVLATVRRFADHRSQAADWRQSRSERMSAAAIVLALHAATIALVMLSRSTPPTSANPGLVAFDVKFGAAPQLHSAHPHPHVARAMAIASTPPLPIPLIDIAPIAAVTAGPNAALFTKVSLQQTAMALGAACDLTQPVQDVLRHDQVVERQLPTIPAGDRSVANAIVMWNAGWITAANAPTQAALATIRQAITQTITASSAECRNQVQAGPRLLYLPVSAGKTLILALGSGRWTWQQLVDGTLPPPADTGPAITAPLFVQPAVAQAATAATGQSADAEKLLASLVRKRSPTGLPFNP